MFELDIHAPYTRQPHSVAMAQNPSKRRLAKNGHITYLKIRSYIQMLLSHMLVLEKLPRNLILMPVTGRIRPHGLLLFGQIGLPSGP